MSRLLSHSATQPLSHSRRSRAQVAIEMVLALMGATVLFVGIMAVWSWLVGSLVAQQRAFDRSRVTAATPTPATAGAPVNFRPKKLSVWGD